MHGLCRMLLGMSESDVLSWEIPNEDLAFCHPFLGPAGPGYDFYRGVRIFTFLTLSILLTG